MVLADNALLRLSNGDFGKENEGKTTPPVLLKEMAVIQTAFSSKKTLTLF